MNAAPREQRIPIGPLIGLVGAVLLLISLFLDWWAVLTAFTVFEVLDLVLVFLALGTIAALLPGFGVRVPGLPAGPALALPLGAAALLVVASQLLNNPPAVVGRDLSPEIGAWIGLGGSLLMVAGGLLAAARISLALDLERREPERAGRTPEPGAEQPVEERAGAPADAETPAARRAARRADARPAEPRPADARPADARPDDDADADADADAADAPTSPLWRPERAGGEDPRAPERPPG